MEVALEMDKQLGCGACDGNNLKERAKREQLPALCTIERSKHGLQIKFVLGWIYNYKIPEPRGFRASVCHLSPEQAAWRWRLVLQLATIELRMRAVLSFFLSSILLF